MTYESIALCARCGRTVSWHDDAVARWESIGEETVCSNCVTPEEQEALDEAFFSFPPCSRCKRESTIAWEHAEDFDSWHFGETDEETLCPHCITTADLGRPVCPAQEEAAEMGITNPKRG